MTRALVPVISLCGFLLSPSALAAIVPDLSSYFDQKITQVEDSVCSLDETPSAPGPSLLLQDVNLDLAPSVTIGITDVLSLSIAPEIDFILVPNQ